MTPTDWTGSPGIPLTHTGNGMWEAFWPEMDTPPIDTPCNAVVATPSWPMAPPPADPTGGGTGWGSPSGILSDLPAMAERAERVKERPPHKDLDGITARQLAMDVLALCEALREAYPKERK